MDGGTRRLLVVAGSDAEPLASGLAGTATGEHDAESTTAESDRSGAEIELLGPPDRPRRRAGASADESADAPRPAAGGPTPSESPDSTSAGSASPPPDGPPELRLVRGDGPARFLGTFLLSYGFYLLLGDPFSAFDLVTGAATAGVVATTLSATLFEEPPSVGRTLPRLARGVVFVPYLLYEVGRANLGVAAVVLAPSLPVAPELVTVRPETESAYERTVLANAVTLTPGTVTVDVHGREFVVHSLTPASRRALEGGALARAVRFVFHGRDAFRRRNA